jgi:ankyrin repeat protein
MARLQMDNLRKCDSVRSVRRTLLSLPEGLQCTYTAFISRIFSSPMAATAKRLIGWLLWAARPLSIKELMYGLSIEDGDTSHDSSCLIDIDAIISYCEGVVVVEEESRIVRFVHYTFQKFLETQPPESQEQVHGEMAKSCQTYLLFQSFSTGRCRTDTEMNLWLGKYPFLLYAAKSWVTHFRKSRQDKIEHDEPVIKMLEDPSFREACLQAYMLPDSRYDLYSWTSPKHAPRLWLASLLSLRPVAAFLLRRGSEVDEEASDGSTALFVAAKSGCLDVMQLLLDNGASPDGGKGIPNDKIPIHEASRRGSLKAVELLHGAGVDFNARTQSGRTALFEAISNDRDDIAHFLIRSGSDVNETTTRHWSLLHTATARSSISMIRLLVSKEPGLVTKSTDDGETPLHVAVEHESPVVVAELIKLGSNVDAGDCQANRPLHLAAARGFARGCELLLTNRCQLDTRNALQETPFHKACAAGHCAAVEVLIKAGADLKAPDLDNSFPLNHAALNGHLDIVRVLLDAGAEVDAANIMGRTALHDAAENGHAEVVRLLLARGADQSRSCLAARNPVIEQRLGERDDPQHVYQSAVAPGQAPNHFTARDLAVQNSRHGVLKILSLSPPINSGTYLSTSGPAKNMCELALIDIIDQQVLNGILNTRLKRELRRLDSDLLSTVSVHMPKEPMIDGSSEISRYRLLGVITGPV